MNMGSESETDQYELMPEAERKRITYQAMYSGRLPMAGDFERYEKTTAGAGDRILIMEEKNLEAEIANQQFWHNHYPKFHQDELRQQKLGQMLGVFCLLVCVVFAFVLAVTAQNTADRILAGAFVAAPIFSVILRIIAR